MGSDRDIIKPGDGARPGYAPNRNDLLIAPTKQVLVGVFCFFRLSKRFMTHTRKGGNSLLVSVLIVFFFGVTAKKIIEGQIGRAHV